MKTENGKLLEIQFDKDAFSRYRVLSHGLFWLCFVLYEGVVWGNVDGAYSSRLFTSLIELPVKIAATYFTLYVLIDRMLLKKKYELFLGLLLASMIGFGLLLRVIAYYIIYPLYYPEATAVPLFFPSKILIAIFATYSLVAFLATFHLIKHWYRHQQATQQLQKMAQQLEKEKLEAELKLLKSQINPHFLFNILNSLYVLALHSSEKTPDMVYKLSQLMSYMLYDSNQAEVCLEKEIAYIENYISLEKIRYGKRLDVSLNVYEEVKDIKIAPLLLLPFVENSFKHGVSNQLHVGWVRIDILVQRQELVFKIENSKSQMTTLPASGIGLQNVKKRLDLIYQDSYDLKIYDEDDSYLVILKIDIGTGPVKNVQKLKEVNL